MLSRADWRGEWLIAGRHPLLWAVVLAALALTGAAASNVTPSSAREAAEVMTRTSFLIPFFLLPFVAGALAPVFFLREAGHGLGELFAATPQTPRRWLAVRLGSLIAVLAALGAAQHGLIAALVAGHQPDQAGALAWRAAGLFLAATLPASLIWSCVLARVSHATGRTAMVHLAAAFGWLALIGLATMTGTPLIAGSFVLSEPLRQAMMLADPTGATALVSPDQTRWLALVLGRTGWLAVCWWLLRGITAIPGLPREGGQGAAAQPARGWQSAGTLALLLRWTFRDRFVLLALAGWAVLVFPEVYGGMHYAEQLAVLGPDSRDALNRVMWDMAGPMGALMLLALADRAGRMARMTGTDELIAATPRASWRMAVAQMVCLWLAALALLGLTLAIVLAAQLLAGSPVQLREYAAQGTMIGAGLLLAASAFAVLHALIRARMAANLLGLALIVLGHSSLAPALGLDHPLWRPLSLPYEMPDHVLGLGGNWPVLAAYGSFWAALCGGALVLAMLLHHRSLPYPQGGRGLRHPATLGALALAGLAGWQGLDLHRSLASDGALESADARAARRAAYERRYALWQDRAQPQIAAVRLRVAFASDGRSVAIDGALRLVNRSAAPIGEVLVGRSPLAGGDLALAGADRVSDDPATGQSVFRLAAPMQPGEARDLRVSTRVSRSPLAPADSLLILRPEFAFVPAFQLLPVVGYQLEQTLRDPAQRAEQGLPPLRLDPPSRLGARLAGDLPRHLAMIETEVITPPGWHALAPGDAVRQWQQGARRHALFRTGQPIRNLPAVAAAPWAPQRWQAGAVTLEVFAPHALRPDDSNLLAMRDMLGWLGAEVAPYPGRTLRLIAAPEYGASGFALPQTMLISHRRGFRARPAPGAGFDQAYRRAAHETAHQWFGHLIGFGVPEERAFLIESLAKYAELVMVERRFGQPAMAALVGWEADRLARARLVPAEQAVPLIDAEDSEDMYSRATLAFACLRARLGDAAITGALAEVVRASRQSGRPALSRDFVATLARISGDREAPALLLTRPVAIDAAMVRLCPAVSAMVKAAPSG